MGREAMVVEGQTSSSEPLGSLEGIMWNRAQEALVMEDPLLGGVALEMLEHHIRQTMKRPTSEILELIAWSTGIEIEEVKYYADDTFLQFVLQERSKR